MRGYRSTGPEDEELDEEQRRSPSPGKRTLTQHLIARSPAGGGEVADDTSGVNALLERPSSAGGAPVPEPLRGRFEESLGARLADVRVHTDTNAAGASGAIGARAFTVGQDVFFGAGQYDPASKPGQHLLAHEVAHTVQQAGGAPQVHPKLAVTNQGDAVEVEADRAADAMVAGQPAAVSSAPIRAARAVDPEAPTALADPPAADAVRAPGKIVVTVNIKETAGKMEYDAADYLTLYKQVSDRAATGKCAGMCDCGLPDCGTKEIEKNKVTITVAIETTVPTWKQRASAPKEHQAKFDAWAASVKVHEDTHLKMYRDGFNQMKTLLVGPTDTQVFAQFDKQWEAMNDEQTKFDADKSKQPAALDIPGGMEKIPANPPAASPKATSDDGGSAEEAIHIDRKASGHDKSPTIHDVATAAVEAKDAGAPIDATVQQQVEPHLGVDLGDVRVHGDGVARQASQAMGARAFTFGRDVFLGPGESGSDVELMAHELTHVAQQGAAGRKAAQPKVTVGDAHSPAEAEADAVAGKVVSGAAPGGALVVDGAAGPGQMTRDQFLSELRAKVIEAAQAALGMFWSVAGCPYIERWFALHEGDSAAQLEGLARRFSGLKTAKDAREYIPPILAKLSAGIAKWRDGGDVGNELALAGMSGAAEAATASQPAAGGGGGAQAKLSTSGGGASPDDVARELGAGQALDASTASRMSGAFGEDFSTVRVHTGAEAARKTSEAGATAFAVGNDVAFAPGMYNPGTPVGDALLAHELAHVVQQKTAGDDPVARRKPIGGESAAAETDADDSAMAVLNYLYRGYKTAADRVKPAMATDFQLQRCDPSEPGKKGLIATDFKGGWEGSKVAEQTSVGDIAHTSEIRASRTLGVDSTEAASIARVKTNGKPGAVILENGKYISYEVDKGFHYRESEFTSGPDPFGESHTTTTMAPKLAPGVSALVSNEMTVVRPNKYDPKATGMQGGDGGAKHLKSTDDPFQGYKDALGDGKSVNGVDKEKLISAFNAAMQDTAMVILSTTERDVRMKKERFDRASGGAVGDGVSVSEMGVIKKTAEELAAKDVEIAAGRKRVADANMSHAMSQPPAGGGGGMEFGKAHREKAQAEQKQVDALELQRKIIVSHYPLLSRVDPKKFKALSEEEMVKQLGGEMPGMLKDIETVRGMIADGQNLWEIDSVVDATIAGLGLDEANRKVIVETKAKYVKEKKVAAIVRTVLSVGFSIAAAFTTGGVSLFFTAGAFGLGVYDAIEATDQYHFDKPASNVGEDKYGGMAEDPSLGWLVVAWVGVGLDALDVAKAVKVVGQGGDVAKAAKVAAASKSGKALGLAEGDLVTKLRAVAGDVDGATKFSEAHRAVVAGRFGANIDIDPKLVGDVRVLYDVEKGTGRVTVKGVKVGPEATLAEVLAHERLIGLMRRYDGISGKIREYWDKLLSIMGKSPSDANPFPPGSQAYDSWLELKKLPELVEARLLKYGDGAKDGIKGANESALKADLDFLDNELKRHQKFVDEIALEKGAGFIAKTGDSSRAAVKVGYPLPPDIKTIEEIEKSAYFYKVSDQGDGTFTLSRKVDSTAPSLRPELGPGGKPTGKFISGELSRAEEAIEIVKKFPEPKQKKFEALKLAEEAKGNKVVPIEGMATTDQTILQLTKEFGPADFKAKVYEIVLEALTRKGDPDAVAKATKATKDLLDHPIIVVQGTDQLRAHGYRAAYLRSSKKAAEEVDDLHHMVPLYLGGDHTKLVDLHADLHRRLHELVEGVKWDKAGTSLAPHSIQKAELNFKQGAAILHPDGTVSYNPL